MAWFGKKTEIAENTVLDKRFRLEKRIAKTFFSEIFRGSQLSTNQPVAIKILRLDRLPKEDRPELRARFQREMSVYSKLRHPNSVRLLDCGDLGDIGVYMVLEFIEGDSLATLLLKERRLGVFESKRLMIQCLDALSSAHALGIVHRDFKPQNIMIPQSGTERNAVVLDFGLAGTTAAWQSFEGNRLTRPGEIAGTVAYLAPEQIRGEVTVQSDIYAWALVYLEALTGKRVFTGDSAYAIVVSHVNEDVPIPQPIATHALGAILRKATARKLEDRYTSAAEVLEDLRTCAMANLEADMESAFDIPIVELIPDEILNPPRKHPERAIDTKEEQRQGPPPPPGASTALNKLYRAYLSACHEASVANPMTFDAFVQHITTTQPNTKLSDANINMQLQVVDGEVLIQPIDANEP